MEYVSKIVALKNVGAICYFNSMVQALFSCPLFNKHIRNIDEPVAREYVKLLDFNSGTAQKIEVKDTTALLKAMLARQNGQSNMRYGYQEDLHEGLSLFLEFVGNTVNLFKIKHKLTIDCEYCSKSHEVPTTPYECSFIVGGNPQTQQEMEQFIKMNKESIPDYKCDCGNQGPLITRTYRLARIPEILVLVYNKNRPGVKYFPPKLSFASKTPGKMLNYKVTAQVEHSGTANSGHYYVRALHPTPGDFSQVAKEGAAGDIQNQINVLQRDREILIKRKTNAALGYKIADKEVKDARKKHYMDIINKLNEVDLQIRNLSIQATKVKNKTNVIESRETVFLFDDTRITHVKNFVPNANTYVVFYHLDF
jgi:ubiquitin carboxyl-terminal hydrolase